MRLALSLAKKGEGRVSPNPMVGAVMVKDNKLVGQGYHGYFGGPHAEVEAIQKAGDEARDATLYVTLEPCSHYGKTPPCTRKIIQSGLARVIAAILDPAQNSGRGMEELRKNGIETEVGICEEEAKKINEAFFKFTKEGIPFVMVKAAASLDGKIATCKGESQWITNEKSRQLSHNLRNKADAILVGINTIISDDPSLLPPSPKNFARIVLDSKLRISLDSRVLKDQDKASTFIFTTSKADKGKLEELKDKGIKVAIMKEDEGKVNLEEVLRKLGELKIMNLLVEGGGEVIGSFFDRGYVDKIILFLAPRIIGGRKAPTWVEGRGIDLLARSHQIRIESLKRINGDLLLEGYVK